MLRVLFAAVIAVAVCSPALAQITSRSASQPARPPASRPALVENPEYQNWAGFKPGTVIKRRLLSDADGVKTESVSTFTLKEVGADRVIVDSYITIITHGSEQRRSPQSRAIAARVPKPDADRQLNESGKQGEGEEEIECAGRKWKTRWVEVEKKAGDIITRTRTWTSKDAPGSIVKRRQQIDGPVSLKTEEVLIEVQFDAPSSNAPGSDAPAKPESPASPEAPARP